MNFFKLSDYLFLNIFKNMKIRLQNAKNKFKQNLLNNIPLCDNLNSVLNQYNLGEKEVNIFNIWRHLYNILGGDCNCNSEGDCKGKIILTKFLKEKGFDIEIFNDEHEPLDGYFFDNLGNKFYFELKYNYQSLEQYDHILCFKADKLNCFDRYGIDQFYSINIGNNGNIYFITIPRNYKDYPNVYKIFNIKTKRTEQFYNHDIIREKKLYIPIELFRRYNYDLN
jgi:hypothetical protein